MGISGVLILDEEKVLSHDTTHPSDIINTTLILGIFFLSTSLVITYHKYWKVFTGMERRFVL